MNAASGRAAWSWTAASTVARRRGCSGAWLGLQRTPAAQGPGRQPAQRLLRAAGRDGHGGGLGHGADAPARPHGGGSRAPAGGEADAGLRLRRPERGPGVGRRPGGGAAGAAVVSEALRHRDELPAAARVPGPDDAEGRGLSAAAGGAGAAAAAGVGMADVAAGARPRGAAEGTAGGTPPAAAAGLVGGGAPARVPRQKVIEPEQPLHYPEGLQP